MGKHRTRSPQVIPVLYWNQETGMLDTKFDFLFCFCFCFTFTDKVKAFNAYSITFCLINIKVRLLG